MHSYFIKRFLLLLPTLFGITLVCFLIMQVVPGGPVEQALQRMKMANQQEFGGIETAISNEELDRIRQYYGFDKPILARYFIWLGKLMHFDFGTSYSYEKPVLEVILSRIPISLTFGLVGLFFTYLVCIPLGIKKALKHGEVFDNWSSFLIFLGYAIPSFALAVALIIVFGGGSFWNIFPISGVVSDRFEELPLIGKIIDYIHHMFLPIICYTIGGFASLTLLMKNSLMEQLNQDYIRTAMAKGLSYHNAVFRHALRNALIPITTNIGMIIGVVLSGSLLIETIFTIDGMGLLGYQAIVNRDYPIALGLIVISSLLMLIGRIISDFCLMLIDPRIKFR